MATTVSSLDTGHEEMIHDAQLDYYGKRLATASSDRTIKIFEMGENKNTQVAEIKGHEGPVWQVTWAHPKFGSILASCSYDKKVIIWNETSSNQWTKMYEFDRHEGSVNSISFAPHEFGLKLACASSDCSISIISLENNNWEFKQIKNAHNIGVNSISWAPLTLNSLISSSQNSTPIQRFVSGGCDKRVKIWKFTGNGYDLENELDGHSDWVRDVAWAPNIGLPYTMIASCSQDGLVIIWTQDHNSKEWKEKKLKNEFADVVWRVSWSTTSAILAVSSADNKVTLWKENLEGEWKCISSLEE